MLYILASRSPRRIGLLKNIGLDPKVIPADIDESQVSADNPSELVTRLSMLKALHVAKKWAGRDCLCIGADTCVYLDGEILGKPSSKDDAERMLRALSGRTHQVFTGYSAVRCSTMETAASFEMTRVRFRELSDEEIAAYIASGEPMDKAGAYGIQELGSLFIEGVEGDYFNVVGLPVCALGKMLEKEFGIKLLHAQGAVI